MNVAGSMPVAPCGSIWQVLKLGKRRIAVPGQELGQALGAQLLAEHARSLPSPSLRSQLP